MKAQLLWIDANVAYAQTSKKKPELPYLDVTEMQALWPLCCIVALLTISTDINCYKYIQNYNK